MRLPYCIVVSEPGQYITRNGNAVYIFSIVPGSSFPCKGYIIKKDTSGRVRKMFSTWALDGRNFAIAGSSTDIVL